MHPVLLRLHQKALANQLAIAVGSSLSDAKYAIIAKHNVEQALGRRG